MRASIMAIALLAAGCAGSMPQPRGTGAFTTQPAAVQGTLVEARHYLEAGVIGGDHTFCAYQSALAGAPLGVVTGDGRLVMLAGRPGQLAAYVTRTVRITGELTGNGQLLIPSSLRVQTGATWTAAELEPRW
ncbi:MAG TPA: hypothetical protein VHN14_34055 [Kofleriaceae bacterium]|jgi:hypothetical protein|nr:hypothetical protein [Kofleriaceae bacterium]